MAESGAPPPWIAHRFVPTLTEVVQHQERVPASADSESMRESLEEFIERAIRRAETSLSRQLPDMLEVILQEHALALSDRFRDEIRAVVRQTVTDAIREKLPELKLASRSDGSANSTQ
jgi:hypothetical protein